MRADYDSRADSLEIVLIGVEVYPDDVVGEDVGRCTVDVDDVGRVSALQTLGARAGLADLAAAAERYGLDREALDAAAHAAIAAPDRVITIDVAETAAA
jgi:hypothetical protein